MAIVRLRSGDCSSILTTANKPATKLGNFVTLIFNIDYKPYLWACLTRSWLVFYFALLLCWYVFESRLQYGSKKKTANIVRGEPVQETFSRYHKGAKQHFYGEGAFLNSERKLCSSYLTNRSYQVKVGSSISQKMRVDVGTAQGSVLGPLHYLAYVNDINNIIRYCTVYQYADDTCLISAANDLHIASKNLQCDFDNVCRWSHDAGLVLNADKTKLLHISSSHNISGDKLAIIAHTHLCLHVNSNYNVTYTCSCPSLEEVSSQKYLGLIIDNRFNWGVHIEHVCNKLRDILAKFYVINNRIPFSVKLAMYNALAESVISYGLSSYGRTFDTYLNEIYKLQASSQAYAAHAHTSSSPGPRIDSPSDAAHALKANADRT
ncbi:reverse transcriptase (RNA-dependent DNA polymerase) domain-containing protein [Phthorimaea operculella]|nr:reverse transcriptase (RNA-dependent DNA polymerase) domain-containing protein [Phthorimaea operculella]